MTQEEKAKAYDEALTIAKRIISKNCSEVEKLCLKSIFPELAESEDEKMINELQGFLDSFGADYFGTGEWQKFHDWLEKQKESLHISETCKENPNSFTNEDERIRKFLVDYAIEMIAGLESDISLSTYDGIKGHDPEAEAELAQWQKARAYLEKQKDLAAIPDELVKNYKLFCENGHREVAVLINAINGINEQKEQRPTEWSEEDEAMIKSILFVLESYVSKAECEQNPALTATYPTYYKEIDRQKFYEEVLKRFREIKDEQVHQATEE